MIKELLISFVVCIAVGAIVNGMNMPAPPASTPPAADNQSLDQQQQSDAASGNPDSATASGTAAGSTTTADASAAASNAPKAPETGDASFDQDVLKSHLPVLVDFNAAWAAPCQVMAPIVDGIAHDYNGKVKVFMVDTDRNPDVREKFKITMLPTFMVFRDGRPVSQYSGPMAKEMLVGVIDHQLGAQ